MFGNLDWRWIAIGVAIMFGLNLIASLILVPLIGDSLPVSATNPQDAAAALSGCSAAPSPWPTYLLAGWSRSWLACWGATSASGIKQEEPSLAHRAQPLPDGRLAS